MFYEKVFVENFLWAFLTLIFFSACNKENNEIDYAMSKNAIERKSKAIMLSESKSLEVLASNEAKELILMQNQFMIG